MTTKTALITGASKGIGRELAFIFAEEGCNLLLAARSEQELMQLKDLLQEQYGIIAEIFVSDLSLPDAAMRLFEAVKETGREVDYLVNNAGFGDYGAFADTSWERYQKMIQLNVTTLTQLTHLFVADWRGRKAGRILNVSSTAAFQPGPMMAVYFATKAFVLSLSEAVDNELRRGGDHHHRPLSRTYRHPVWCRVEDECLSAGEKRSDCRCTFSSTVGVSCHDERQTGGAAWCHEQSGSLCHSLHAQEMGNAYGSLGDEKIG